MVIGFIVAKTVFVGFISESSILEGFFFDKNGWFVGFSELKHLKNLLFERVLSFNQKFVIYKMQKKTHLLVSRPKLGELWRVYFTTEFFKERQKHKESECSELFEKNTDFSFLLWV